MPEKEVRVIQSVQRAIDIINCFDEHELKLTLPQISAKLELNINTVRGLVNTLVANGYLEHVADGNCYMLGLAFLPKADLAGANDIDRLRSRVRPSLELIADRFQVSARMQIISNDNIFAVEVVNPIDSHPECYGLRQAGALLHGPAQTGGVLPHFRPQQVYPSHHDHPGGTGGGPGADPPAGLLHRV